MGTLAGLLAGSIDSLAHQAVPQQDREVIGPGQEGTVLQVAIVRGSQGIVEDHAVGNGGELAQLVQGTGNIHISGSPGIAAAAGVAAFGDPHLAAGNILITAVHILTCAVGSDSQILLSQGCLIGPMTAHGGTALRNTIVIVIAEHIHGGLVVAQQLLSGDHLKTGSHTAASALQSTEQIDIANGAGADKQALGIVLLQPGTEEVMVTGMVCGGVALGKAGQSDQIGLVGELGSRDGHAVLLGGTEQQIGLLEGHGLIGSMNTGAVGNGDQQLAVHSLDEVQQAQPLILGQQVLEAFGNDAARMTVKIIVGLVCPGAGNTDPGGAQLSGQLDQTGILGVDGIVPLLEVTHIGPVQNLGELLSAIDLGFGIGLPEGTAGDLGHLHIIRNKTGVHLPKGSQAGSLQRNKLSHWNQLSLFSIYGDIPPHKYYNEKPDPCEAANFPICDTTIQKKSPLLAQNAEAGIFINQGNAAHRETTARQ